MANEDLKVDYYALEDSVTQLDSIRGSLEGLEGKTKATEDEWGHHKIADAMDEFSGNMDYNRGKLVDEVKAMGQMAEGTLEAFRKVETELASAFDKEKA